MTYGSSGSRWFLLLLLVILSCWSWPMLAVAVEQAGVKVTTIEIRGNKRIELPAIAGRLTLKSGDPYTPENVRGQIKILYETGFFEDVQLETELGTGGVALAFLVREKPFITEIVFDGNQELSDDKLKEKITIKSQAFLDQPQAKESAEKIRLAYQESGYFDCHVTPIVQTLDEDRKRLTFFVKEGGKARIKNVNFDGLFAATKNELFKVMATRQWVPWYGPFTQMTLPSFLSDAGVLKREEMNNDAERIKEILLNKGYLNVLVGLPDVELSQDKQWFTVTYAVIEGEPFTVAEVGFRGNTAFEDAELFISSRFNTPASERNDGNVIWVNGPYQGTHCRVAMTLNSSFFVAAKRPSKLTFLMRALPPSFTKNVNRLRSSSRVCTIGVTRQSK